MKYSHAKTVVVRFARRVMAALCIEMVTVFWAAVLLLEPNPCTQWRIYIRSGHLDIIELVSVIDTATNSLHLFLTLSDLLKWH